MAQSSYHNLLKQVECLKTENSQLKLELEDNSSSLTKLENEASNMKNVLSHLQTIMVEDLENYTLQYHGTENGGTSSVTSSMENLDQNSNHSDDGLTDSNTNNTNTNQGGIQTTQKTQNDNPNETANPKPNNTTANIQLNIANHHNSQDNSQTPPQEGSPSKRQSGDKELYSLFLELDRERQKIVQDLEDENVNCKWYHEQLEEVTNKVEQLPVTDNYNLQTDMARRQLDFEAQRIRDLMQENYGTTEHISQRHEARLQRIRMIETEMLRIQRLHKAQQMALQKQSEEQTEAKHDDVLVVDAATSTIDSQKMAAKECNDSRATFHPPNGTRHNNLSSQSPVIDEQKQNNQNLASLYHGAWPMEKGVSGEGSLSGVLNQETSSVMSFNSSNASTGSRRANQQQLGTKVEMVYSLLSMLGTHDKDDMSRTLLAMSSSQDSCIAMRQSGCLPLLIQLLHGNDKESGLLGNTRGSKAARARAAAALHNIVHSHPDDKRGRREARVLRLLEQIRAHCDQLRDVTEDEEEGQRSRPGSAARSADIDHHPGPAIAALMKLSFDEEHRHAICTLGGLQAIAELLYVDHEAHHSTTEQYNITMRRYACMALTNLTFGDGTNKALLCSMKLCMHALVAQLESPNEDLRQVAASVLRNLSWRADLASKKTLREVGAVTALMKAALEVQKESTLKSVLSALWNLSAHCSENKADICAVDGALAFLVSTLTYKSPSKTLAIIENGGGMLRNVSSHIAVREDYRKILRTQGCMHILLKHLRSPSLTIVSNACGTLWNLSARCTEDQQALWEMGAVSMLRNLVHSKHKMISMGSAAALKNLLGAKPAVGNIDGDKHSRSNMPSLTVRKYKQLESELDQNLSETCDNIESPRDSPQEVRKHPPPNNRFMYQGDSCGMYQVADSEHRRPLLRSPIYSRGSSGENSPLLDNRLRSPQRPVARTGSQDSVGSTHSDISHDRVRVSNMLTKSKLSQDKPTTPERKLSQRNNDNFRGSSSPIDPKSNILAPNSRIMQIMQEVVMHAETTDKGGREPHTTASAPASPKTQVRPMGRGRSIPVYNRQQPDPAYKGTNSAHASPVINHRQFGGENRLNNIANYQKSQFSNLPQKVENLKLTDADQEQPINYSLKYSDNQKQDNFKRPLPPKVGNYVAGLAYNSGQQKNSNAPQGKQTKPPRQNHGYAETDLDSVDQPTNYGMRYTEEDEEVQFTEQPINYSTRYRDNENCADCKLHMARRTNDIIDEHICDDQVKAFYTEDTPYLSTATSLTDLSKHKHGDDHGGDDSNSPPSDEQPQNYANKYPESEDRSTNGSHSTCEHSRSTVIHVAKPQPPRSVQEPTEMENAPPMNMRSYIDTNDMLPPEKPKTYAEEGTPLCFSRVSSLSSLHSSEAQDRGNSKPPHDPALQSIAEGKIIDTTDRHNRSQGENPANISQGAESTASGPAKSVTFDEHNNIQETPMMFSRCSSLGSLSSFDAHSVHSSVISEYSRRASEVVSPSDLPDSPSDTVPNTPKRSKSPVKFPELGNSPNKDVATPVVNPHQREAQSLSPTKMGPPLHPPLKPNVNQSRGIEPEKFTRDPQHFSTTSSLSALSFDDDEPKIQKDNDLATIPLTGERGDMFKMEQATPKPKDEKSFEPVYGTVTKEDTDTSKPNDLDEGSSVSEVSDGDEDILAACISSAMPSKSSKSKMRKSHSDHSIKKTRGNPQRSGFGSKIHGVRRSASGSLSPRSKLPPNFPAGKYPIKPIPDPWGSIDEIQTFAEEGTPLHLSGSQSPTELVPPVEAPAMRQQQIQPQQNIVNSKPDTMRFKNPEPHMVHPSHNFNPGHVQSNISSHGDSSGDTLKNFAVEDTPHNFSTATSLSDLSFTPDGGDSMKNDDERALAEHVKNNDAEDSHKGDPSDMSSLDDDEDLLSELIDSAMPKSIKKKSHGSTQEKTEANESKNLATKQQHGSVFKKGFQPLRTSSERSDAHIGASDSVRTYAVEGTPANLSTATSLSNLTVDDYNSKSYGEPFSTSDHPSTEPNMHSTAATFGSIPQEDDVFLGVSSCYDSPKVYGVEGTPFSFSRNDSLSSLDCEDDAETGSVNRHKMTPRKQGPLKKLSIPQSPRQVEGSSGGSTPHSKAILSKPPIPSSSKTKSDMPPNVAKDIAAARKISGDDISKNYEVEGTPMCFSRNSSLSSLNSEDMVAKAKSPEGIPVKDDNESFVLEDTPLSFSRNSSLSSLSINSVDSEPSASEQALLDECINSAMPKKTPSKVDKSKSKSKTSPGASATKTKTPPGKSTKSKPAVKTLPAKQPSQPINQQPQPAKQSSQPVKQPSQPFKQPPQPAAKPNVSHRSRNPQSRSASRQISDSNSNVIPTGSNNNHITNPSSRANNNADNNRDESLNCFNPMMQTDTNANLSSWRKMPHKSSEDFRVSKNTAEGNTSSWRRTRSQDGDLKQRKEATNQEKAQESTAMIWKKMPELHLVNNVITVANVSATLAQIDSNKSSPSCSTKTHETLQYPDNKLSEMHLNDAGHESGTEKMDSCKENDSDESEHDKPEHDDAIEALRDADRSIQQFQPEVFCPLQDPDPEDNSEPLGLGPFQDKSPFQDRGKNIICDSRTKISLDSPDDPDGIVLEDEVDINDTLDSIEIIDMDDIMQETFPDDFPMANSGGSIIPAHPDTDSSKDDQSEKLSQDDVTTTDQSEKLPFDDVTNTTSIDQPIEVPHIEPHDLSVEDERLLEENANLVLSELTTQHLEGSVNDDLFIDNETLSLVSNDFTDDNASEISLSLSASSKTLSETTTASDVTSTVAQPSTARPRPRIIKPTDKEYIERKAAEEQKGIRGAKKNYRGVKSFSSASSVKSSVSSKSSVSLTSKNQKPVTPIRGGNKPTTNGPKAVTPRKPIASKTSQNGKSTPLKGNAGTSKGMSTPTKGTSAPAKGTPSPPKGTNNTQPTNYGTYTKNGPKGTQKSKVTTQKPSATPDVKPVNSKQSDPSDRPKPPIKQGTFTKDTASTNSALPTISSNRSAESECDDESVRFSLDVDNDATEYSFNQDDDDLTDLSIPGVILRKKRLSGGSHGSSGSVRHSSSSPRNSSGSTSSGDKFTPPTSWTNTLEGNFHFVVDTSQQQGYDAPYKQIQMKRHASDAPPALKKQVSNESNKTMNDLNKPTRQTTKVTPGTNLTKTASGNSLSKSGGTVTKTSSGSSLSAKSAASKTSGVTNLKKTSSGGSLSKGSPGSGIPKTPSGSNLNKTNTGSAVAKTSTSAGNLRKTSSGSNLTKNSPGSSISKTSSGGNLTKTTSGTSIAKRGSDGSLSSRNGSNGSVNKPLISPRETKTSALRNGAKSNLQKSESNTSLKKAAGPSKTTPASPRRGSNTSIASTPSTTPTKPGAKKPVTSKISGLWKREDGKSVVPVANNSRTASPSGKPPTPTKSQKPEVKIQNTTQNKIGSKSPKQIRKVAPPTKVNLPANKVKPLTPPRKSSAVSPVQKSSPVDAPSEGIKRSSTYDKLSPEKEPEVTQPKASGGWRKAPNNVSDSDSDCTPKPTSGIKKPVGAFRRAVDLQGSDSDSSGSEKPMRKSGQIWVKRGSNPPPPPPRTSSRLRSSAPPRTMDNNTKQTLLDTEDVAKRRLTYTVPDDTAMPDAPDSTARPMQHVDVVVNVKNCITVNGGLNNGPVTTTSSTTVTSPTKAEITNKVSPSAVVQPYNYTPTQKTTKILPTQKSSSIQKPSNKKPEKIDTDVNEGSDSEKGLKREMTKTEMLIARRRRSYLNSNKSDESIDSDEKKRNCLVTTV